MSDLGHEHPVDPERVADAKARLLTEEETGRLAGLFGLLADPVRARGLYALDLVYELCVGDLALALAVTPDPVGYGRKMLRTGGLVTTRKQGRVVFYRLFAGLGAAVAPGAGEAMIGLPPLSWRGS